MVMADQAWWGSEFESAPARVEPFSNRMIDLTGSAFEEDVLYMLRGKLVNRGEVVRNNDGTIFQEIDGETAESLVEIGVSLGGGMGVKRQMQAEGLRRSKIAGFGAE